MQNNRRNLANLFFSMVVVMMGFGMIIPILPFYIIEFGAGSSAMGFILMVLADYFVGILFITSFFVTSNAMLASFVISMVKLKSEESALVEDYQSQVMDQLLSYIS